MTFDEGIAKEYRQSVEDAFDAIISNGNDEHRMVTKAILDSKMLIQVRPVSGLIAKLRLQYH